MQYKKNSLLAYNLHVIKTDKFKTTNIRIDFRTQVTKEDITYRNLLSKILLESSKNYPSKRLLNIATEDLYGMYLSINNSLSGRAIVTSIKGTVLNDYYTEDGNLKKAISFLIDVILNPNVSDKGFDESSLTKARSTLLDEMKALKDNPDSYSKTRALEIVGDIPLSYRTVGYIEDLDKIGEIELYNYYINMLKTNVVDIFIIGDVSIDDITRQFKKELTINTLKRKPIDHIYKHAKFKSRAKKVIEDIDNAQSKLVMVYKLDELTKFESNYVMPVYSYILGGGPDSRLFKNIREKNSLCYSISSTFFSVSNYLIITAGISKNDFVKTTKLIKEEVKKLSKGMIEDRDINNAINTYLSSYKEISDEANGIINSYVVHEYLDNDLLSKREKEIVKVTKNDILRIIPKIHLDLVYLLGGDRDE